MRHNSGRAVLLALGFVLVHSAALAQKAKLEQISPRQLWSTIKRDLTAPDGQEYFDQNLDSSEEIVGGFRLGQFAK